MPKIATDPQAEILKSGPIPAHVAVIMDGNGRWARRRFLPRIEGHRAGTKAVRRAIETSRLLGVRYLTLYTFSLENWERPKTEVADLMRLLKQHLIGEQDRLLREGISLRAVGDLDLLPAGVRAVLAELEETTGGGRELRLTLALSYGSRQEIARAAMAAAEEAARDGAAPSRIDAAWFARHLQSADLPPIDVLIRTSGERRLSNFLLWQAAGAYLHFTPTLWPSFGKLHYFQAVRAWQAARADRGGIARAAAS